mmetsp:Transcript_5664/g.14381  ORF Transcript_5664/g.14381 Transcript_5664/m.14381 type:complete len:142 (+) Transcript_5664:17-442(+)
MSCPPWEDFFPFRLDGWASRAHPRPAHARKTVGATFFHHINQSTTTTRSTTSDIQSKHRREAHALVESRRHYDRRQGIKTPKSPKRMNMTRQGKSSWWVPRSSIFISTKKAKKSRRCSETILFDVQIDYYPLASSAGLDPQ